MQNLEMRPLAAAIQCALYGGCWHLHPDAFPIAFGISRQRWWT